MRLVCPSVLSFTIWRVRTYFILLKYCLWVIFTLRTGVLRHYGHVGQTFIIVLL